MQPNAKKLATDVIFLVESTPFIGVCYDLILDNYLKPLIQHFYGTSNFDDLGLIKDLSGVVFSAITYKGLTSLPSSICTHVQPTSHAKLFYDKLDHLLESFILEDQAHMAEGFALALDLFEDLENRRRGNKSERVASNRHIILVASQSAYDEVPIFESNNYRGLKYEEILQSLQKLQVNLSIISPSFRPEFIRLYEKVNNSGSGQNQGEFKLDKYGTFTFFNALHNSIQLVDYEAQQQKLQQQLIQQKQLAQKQAAEAAAAAAQQAAQQNVPVAVPAATQETIKSQLKEMETNQPSVVIAPQQPVAAAYQQPQQQAPPSQQTFQQTQYQQQQQPTTQPQQPQQTLQQQQKIVPQQPPTQMGDIYAQQQQQAPVAAAAKPAVVTAPVQIHPQQQTQQQTPHQMQIPGQATQAQNPPGGGQNLPTMQQPTQQMPPMQQIPTQPQVQQTIQQPIIRPALNIAQSQQLPQQPPQMANIRQMGAGQVIQQQQTQPIMGGPQVGAAVVPNQGGQQPNLQGQYGQMNPSPVGPSTTPVQQQVYSQQQQQQQPSQTPQTTQQQQQTSGFGYNTQQATSASAAAAPVAGNRHAIWTGQIEWAEKDRNNPNIKSNHYANATMYSFMNAIDPNTGDFVSEVSHASAQAWPNKISLQMMSKQILDILMPLCGPPARNLILHTDNQDVKNSLTSIGGALINFANINQINLDVKVILVMCQNNEIICKIPADQTKFMNALKQIIAKQKQQQQQRMQQVAQPQQPTPQQPQPNQQPQMIQPQMQMNQVGAPMMQGMVPQQPGQIMMQPNMQANANNWINVPQQMQPQQPQMYMQQNMMTQQQQQQQQQQPKQNFNFGGQNY